MQTCRNSLLVAPNDLLWPMGDEMLHTPKASTETQLQDESDSMYEKNKLEDSGGVLAIESPFLGTRASSASLTAQLELTQVGWLLGSTFGDFPFHLMDLVLNGSGSL